MSQPDQIYHSDIRRTLDNTTTWGMKVKKYGYDYTNLLWRPIAVNDNGEIITSEATMQRMAVIYSSGDAVVNNLIDDGIYFKADVKITKITVFADISPTGADLIIDQTVNGIAQNKPATLSDGSQYEETDTADLTVLTTDRYGLKITQIGSTTPGTNLKVHIFYEKV